MGKYCSVTIPQSTGVDTKLLSIATIFYWNSHDTGTIPQSLLKIMVTPDSVEHFQKIVHKFSTIILPDHISPTDLANTFGHFFSDKIMKIRGCTSVQPLISIIVVHSHRCFSPLQDQEATTAPYNPLSQYLRMTSSKA